MYYVCFKENSAIKRTSAAATALRDSSNAVDNLRRKRIVIVDSDEDNLPAPVAEVVVKNEQTVPLPMPVIVKQEGIVANNSLFI
jgi:hypothetical protein